MSAGTPNRANKEGAVDARRHLGVLSTELTGLEVAELTEARAGAIALRFTNGAVLTIAPEDAGLTATLTKRRDARGGGDAGSEPTRRQREYLAFVKKYMHRFGVAPAESDIQRHFLVSAPSVNQMVRTLERRGFIERDHDWYGQAVPRSIRVVWDG